MKQKIISKSKIGNQREKIGDILVQANGADIIALKEVEKLLLQGMNF